MKNKNEFLGDGIILLNKEKDVSSFGAINKLKWLINAKKVGHAGTLDPMAEGLLIVMINGATKFSENLMKKDKEYYVEMELGYETDSYDSEGKIVNKYKDFFEFSIDKIEEVVMSFLGEILQIPPMYAAIKVNGEKLYNLARKGIDIEREPRKVRINYINTLKYDNINKKISFVVGVSSGTYIRSLVKDIGDKLGVYATMTKLVRTKIDNFILEEAILLEDVKNIFLEEDKNSVEDVIKKLKFKNIEYLFDYDKIFVNEDEYFKLKNGMTLLLDYDRFSYFKYIDSKKIEFLNNEKKKVFLKNNERFVGIIKIIKIGKDKLYIKKDKYFL